MKKRKQTLRLKSQKKFQFVERKQNQLSRFKPSRIETKCKMCQRVRFNLNQFLILFLVSFIFQINCFNLKLVPINSLDLSKANQTYGLFSFHYSKLFKAQLFLKLSSFIFAASVRSLFKYPQQVEPFERFEILEIDTNKNYLILGAR